jgi:hypothetical protein
MRQKPPGVRRRPPALARGRAQALFLLALVWCLLLRRDYVHQRAAAQKEAWVKHAAGGRGMSRGACKLALNSLPNLCSQQEGDP